MRITLITLCAAVLAFSGCSTVTKPNANKVTSEPVISPALQQEAKGLKRKIAIARFSNETKHGSSFLLDESNDRVGKQAMDILSARLTETGKFIMLERADLEKVTKEAGLSGLESSIVGADYLIVGSVSEFGRNSTSEVGIFSRNKKQVAKATVNVRLINVKTGQIVFSEEGSGESNSEANSVFGVGERAGYNSSLDDQALSAAISKVTSNLVENLLDIPWRSYIVDETDGTYIVAGGTEQGIEVGDEFSVFAPGKRVKNPQTGLDIELPGKIIGSLQVVAMAGSGQNEISICTLSDGTLSASELGILYVQEKGDK
jgi:curli biogenesis system outer membrane secretion channel CsgG